MTPQSTSETSDCRKILQVRRPNKVQEKVELGRSWARCERDVQMFLGVGLVLGKAYYCTKKESRPPNNGSGFRRCLSENDEHQHGMMKNATKRGWDGRNRAGQPECVVWFDEQKRLLQQ